MRLPSSSLAALAACSFALSACGDRATLPVLAGYGPNPVLPPANPTLLPTVQIAPAVRWTRDEQPTPAAGFAVTRFAEGLDHPRWLYVLPNGDVLVAESAAPAKEGGGLIAWIRTQFMQRAGAAVPSANRITLLRDVDGDGVAEVRSVLLDGLHSPFGMALRDEELFVANTDAVLRFPYRSGDTRITAAGTKVTDLPAGPRNYHWTRNIVFSRDGRRMYATVGSDSNVAEHGMQAEHHRAAILEIDPDTGAKRVFASGLRNPNGLAWQPTSGALWTTVNERDELGSDLVPDFMTSVVAEGFYGWPYSYFGSYVDPRVEPQHLELVARALVPDYALGAHTSSMGLAFYQGTLFPPRYVNGAFVGQHGSWNRKPPSGYKVIFVPFSGGRPLGAPEDFLTGFLNERGEARGRPVGVAIDRHGALLVADDVGNVVWRVTPLIPR